MKSAIHTSRASRPSRLLRLQADEWPQASQLETARFYPLRVPEVRSLTWVLLPRNQGAGTFWNGQRSIWVPTRWGLVAAHPGW